MAEIRKNDKISMTLNSDMTSKSNSKTIIKENRCRVFNDLPFWCDPLCPCGQSKSANLLQLFKFQFISAL